ncbi:MAG: TetR/AcrR family transcriptional regulator [Colwellia sp.]
MKQSKKGRIRAENNQKILTAAEIEFVKHGYKGTSIQSISEAAGLPKANILYYFTNKAKLYNTLLKNIVLRWNALFTDITEDDDPTETLELYIRTKVEQAITYPNASKIFATEIIQGAPNLSEYLRTDLRHWLNANCKIIESWIEQGKMDRVDPEQLFFLIWSSTQHYADFKTQVLTLYDKREYQPEDIERICRFLCQMILSGCGLTPSHKL